MEFHPSRFALIKVPHDTLPQNFDKGQGNWGKASKGEAKSGENEATCQAPVLNERALWELSTPSDAILGAGMVEVL